MVEVKLDVSVRPLREGDLSEADRIMRKQGFRTDIQGCAMQRSNDPGYHVPSVYIIDDWR